MCCYDEYSFPCLFWYICCRELLFWFLDLEYFLSLLLPHISRIFCLLYSRDLFVDSMRSYHIFTVDLYAIFLRYVATYLRLHFPLPYISRVLALNICIYIHMLEHVYIYFSLFMLSQFCLAVMTYVLCLELHLNWFGYAFLRS